MSVQWPVFNSYTTVYLINLLVTNPGVQSFPLSINGHLLQNPPDVTSAFADVTRAQIINELANRWAAIKQAGTTFDNQMYDFATTIGSYALAAVPAGTPDPTAPASTTAGPANPCQALGQLQ
jgi:hypothetical protein